MKKIVILLIIATFLVSCEKSSDSQRKKAIPDTNFNQKILNGYFVTSIAFDSKGNAWIGTFKQGLIKYNSKETIVYNPSNSLIPANSVMWDIAIDKNDKIFWNWGVLRIK